MSLRHPVYVYMLLFRVYIFVFVYICINTCRDSNRGVDNEGGKYPFWSDMCILGGFG